MRIPALTWGMVAGQLFSLAAAGAWPQPPDFQWPRSSPPPVSPEVRATAQDLAAVQASLLDLLTRSVRYPQSPSDTWRAADMLTLCSAYPHILAVIAEGWNDPLHTGPTDAFLADQGALLASSSRLAGAPGVDFGAVEENEHVRGWGGAFGLDLTLKLMLADARLYEGHGQPDSALAHAFDALMLAEHQCNAGETQTPRDLHAQGVSGLWQASGVVAAVLRAPGLGQETMRQSGSRLHRFEQEHRDALTQSSAEARAWCEGLRIAAASPELRARALAAIEAQRVPAIPPDAPDGAQELFDAATELRRLSVPAWQEALADPERVIQDTVRVDQDWYEALRGLPSQHPELDEAWVRARTDRQLILLGLQQREVRHRTARLARALPSIVGSEFGLDELFAPIAREAEDSGALWSLRDEVIVERAAIARLRAAQALCALRLGRPEMVERFGDPFRTSGPVTVLDDRIFSAGPDETDQQGELLYDPTNGTVSPGDIVVRR